MARTTVKDGEERAGTKDVAALKALMPFMAPYRGLVVAAILALMLTAALSLTLPLLCAV